MDGWKPPTPIYRIEKFIDPKNASYCVGNKTMKFLERNLVTIEMALLNLTRISLEFS
jgi:hypothetical protein